MDKANKPAQAAESPKVAPEAAPAKPPLPTLQDMERGRTRFLYFIGRASSDLKEGKVIEYSPSGRYVNLGGDDGWWDASDVHIREVLG